MKKIFLIMMFVLIQTMVSLAQFGSVGIGTETPDTSAILDISSTSKGLLIPRLDSNQIINISNPADGLIIYNYQDKCFWFHKQNQWGRICNTDSINSSNITVNNIYGDSAFFNYAYIDSLTINGQDLDSLLNQKWDLNGNIINPNNYIGTNNNVDLIFKRNNVVKIILEDSTNINYNKINYFGYNGDTYPTQTPTKIYAINGLEITTKFGFNGNSFNSNAPVIKILGSKPQLYGTGGPIQIIGGDAIAQGIQSTEGGGVIIKGGRGENNRPFTDGKVIMCYDSTIVGSVGIGLNNPNNLFQVKNLINFDTTSYNTFIGQDAGLNNYRSFNTFIGQDAGLNNNAHFNTFIGYKAGYNNNGANNVFFGNSIASSITNNSSFNVILGDEAAFNILSGDNNTFTGYQAGYNNRKNNNTLIGYQAGYSNIEENNTFIGYQAGYNNSTGKRSILIGYQAGYVNLGDNNTFIGYQAGYNNTSGGNNIFLGISAGLSNTSGSSNLFQGVNSGRTNTTGHSNVFIGNDAGGNNITGFFNTLIGNEAGEANTTGHSNVFIGNEAGRDNTTGLNNIYIGTQAGLGNIIQNNTAIIGNLSTTSIGGYTNWTNLSDKRYKKNITENVPGLNFIMQLKAVTYNLDIKKLIEYLNIPDSLILSYKEKENILETGFLAQDVEQIALSLGYEFSGIDKPQNEKDTYGLRYATFVVPLVQAVQEQQKLIQLQEQRILVLEQQIQLILKEK